MTYAAHNYLTRGANETTRKRYATIKIPYKLATRLDEMIGNGDGGYRCRAEIVKDAVRRFIEAKETAKRVPESLKTEATIQTV